MEFEQMRNVWKPELYKLQISAPIPKLIARAEEIPDSPCFYGSEYHGSLGHKESERLLNDQPDGSYLIRKSPSAIDYFTLSLRFDQRTRHYKICHQSDIGHYQMNNTKRFYPTIKDLVADGLVNFYMEKHAAPIIRELMNQNNQNHHLSPYITLNRRKLKALSNDFKLKCLQNKQIFGATNQSEQVQSKEEAGAGDELLPIPTAEKRHMFKVHTFKGLHWCEQCGHFLWGFLSQGVKCEDCGFQAHHKCQQLVPASCIPALKSVRGIFGIDLTNLGNQIPFVVRKCVEEVEARGMLQEGIYRISGFADEIDALKLALDKDGERTDMTASAYSNINVIAGTLKLYLRLLPIPLITFESYPFFMAISRCESVPEQNRELKEALKQLPSAHYSCLKFVIEHLYRVSLQHEVNKMTNYNLATVFAPTLIATPSQLIDLSQEILVLATLIKSAPVVLE